MNAKKIIPAVLVLLAVLGITSVESTPTKPPLRLRVSSKLLRSIFVKNDQQLLDIFQDLPLGDFQVNENIVVKNLTGSLGVQRGNVEDFDFNLSFDESKFLGIESDNLILKGSGIIVDKNGEEESFTYEGPIDLYRLEFQQVNTTTKVGTETKIVDFKHQRFDIAKSKIDIKSSGNKGELLSWDFKGHIQEEIKKAFLKVKDDAIYANPEIMFKLPITSVVPLFGIYYLSMTADNVIFSDKFIEFQYSPVKFKLLSEKAYEKLKDVDSEFEDPVEGEEERAMQLLIDENVINAIFSHLITMDTMYSLRKIFQNDPRFAVFKQLLTTSTVGMVLPSFKEDYGEGKPIDVIGTLSHDFLADVIDNIQFSGISLENKGIVKGVLNAGAQIIVEKNHGEWEDTRQFYITFSFKGKLYVNDTDPTNQTLSFLPRGVEVSTFKIYKGNEEMFLEQILTQSLLNAQVDTIRKSFKPLEIPLSGIQNPKEFQCMGFNLTEVHAKIKKGYIQLDLPYIQVKERDEDFCSVFEKSMREGPMQTFQQLTKQFQTMTGMAKRMGMGNIPGLDIPGLGNVPYTEASESPGFINRPKSAQAEQKQQESTEQPKVNKPKEDPRIDSL